MRKLAEMAATDCLPPFGVGIRSGFSLSLEEGLLGLVPRLTCPCIDAGLIGKASFEQFIAPDLEAVAT